MISKIYAWLHRLTASPGEACQYSGGKWPARIRRQALSRMQDMDGRLIDVGCGEGLFITGLAAVNPRINIIGIDSDENRVRQCLERCRQANLANVSVVRGSGSHMPFTEDFFDAATFLNTLFNLRSEHVVEEVLREIARVMRKDAVLFFDFRNKANLLVNLKYWLAPFYDATIKAQNMPLRTYSLKEINGLLAASGLRMERFTPLGFPGNRLAPIIFVEARKC